MNNNNKITIIAVLTGILTFSILAMTSFSINQVSAQKCQTNLSLGAYPRNGVVGFDSGTLGVSLTGNLKCGDANVVGATIIITGIDGGDRTATTDNFGQYGLHVRLGPGVYTIEAIYEGDNEHDPASATRTVTANEPHQYYYG